MEAAEDASLVPAIAWLVQTILATLLVEKLDTWIGQAGFGDDIERLKSEIRRVGMVVSAVKGRAIGNEPLAQSLAILKELLYDADDVVDELDYYRLQASRRRNESEGMHGVEPVDEISRDADTPNISVGKLRSVVWQHFKIIEKDNGKPVKSVCRYCAKEFTCETKNGTSSMIKHIYKTCKNKPRLLPPNLSSTDDAITNAVPVVIGDSCSRKRRRVDEDSIQITASNTQSPWDKDILSSRIEKITSQLQDIRGDLGEFLKLHGSDLASSSNHHPSTDLYQHLRTSSLVPRKVYGRVAEQDSIIKMITEERSDGVAVLPIVGIAGVGKTTLAQLVYNDPNVESQFDQRIWVWVSHNFDEVRLTREMLDFVSPERHEGFPNKNETYKGINSFAKLQEVLKGHMQFQSKRFLLILDDVSDNMDDYRWNKVLAPLRSSHVRGSVILVTTRNLSVAERVGTLEPIKLGSLADNDLRLLFKLHAFGDENYEVPRNLSSIWRQIAENLKGNPLATESTGILLRKKLSIDHWNDILKNEGWKSMQLGTGIMPALKLSYDRLPYYLQQCFSYCSIFPDSYQFRAKDLVHIWISQGFVKCNHSSKRLEEIGQFYLTDLVNLGFFQKVGEEEDESSLSSQSSYSICGLMHDFARMISRNYCATIDGLLCTKMLPTVQHISVVTDSAYKKDRHGHICRNNKFEEKLRNAVMSPRKLRTLVLIGKYDSHFFQVFQDKFRTAYNLRLLQVSATSADFNSLVCSLVDPTHLRYVKHKSDGFDRPLPLVLTKFFHLQVLDVGSNNDPGVPDGMYNLVSLRHLVAGNGVYSSVANIGSMTSLQELHNFKVQPLSGSFEISQLQSMNELVELRVSQLDNVESREEAYGAGLRDKVHLAKLHLCWKDALSDEELMPMDDGGPSSEPSMGTAREVLEGLEPHMNLKHLQISGYNGATSPTWLASNISVTSLQTLHLDGCRGWRILPSLKSLPFIRKLTLRNMKEVTEVLVPSLEELVLIRMPKLLRCSSTSVEGLSSVLRALEIKECQELKEFDLFENDDKLETRQRSWMPGLRKLVLSDCPHLIVWKPLPPSTTVSELLIKIVSALPTLKGPSSEKLQIGCLDDEYDDFDASCDELVILDDKILAFDNLRNLKSMSIEGCRNLRSFSLEGFSHLVSLKSLEISKCSQLFCSDMMSNASLEDLTAANWKAFPCLESLSIEYCGIGGKWLSLLLRHAPDLEELYLEDILPMEIDDSSSGEEDDALTGLAHEGLVHIPLNLTSSLKKLACKNCRHPTFNCSEEGFSGFTSLQELIINRCDKLLSSLVHKDGNDLTSLKRLVVEWSPGLESLQLHTCTALEELTITYCNKSLTTLEGMESLRSLKKLVVEGSPGLKSLQLHSCTALEELTIKYCGPLIQLEALQSLGRLRHLAVSGYPGLGPCLEGFSRQGYELFPQLETLETDDPSVLTMLSFCNHLTMLSFCNHLTSLRRLQLCDLVLSEEQGRALVLLTSLQELEFNCCFSLVDLPAGLHLLPSLKRLKILYCPRISRLPETGLPLSLEGLEIYGCSKELADQCRGKATSKLRVNIG
ncbi:hypothetical protein QYE76_046308 [Lolium multiflorum]|uniref:BED-type domain-containing protein n=1 Tax=Lolium multiflorum TaxID=4521 RepID=A0AAD8PNS4_LOLMU|nr:hypothetical protein QYE76_018537 [Lolium multiflorum]KAK1685460.1 hypothetical protein QYE76_046308 [Lolium multiflorum]